MKRAVEEQISEFIRIHIFATIYEIRKSRIITNYHSLKKRLDLLVIQDRLEYVRFWKRYFVKKVPEDFEWIKIIAKQADKIFFQLKNQSLKHGSFYREFKIVYKQYHDTIGSKETKVRSLTWDLEEKVNKITEQNERCLLKAFLCLNLKMIIFDLEIYKIQNSTWKRFDSNRIIRIMLPQLQFFEDFFREYDPDSDKIFGCTYEVFEMVLDQIYLDDKEYYKLLLSNKNPFFVVILYWINYLLYDNKKELSENYFAKKYGKNFAINKRPKNLKAITHMFSSFCDKQGNPILEEIFQRQQIERNRISRIDVTNNMICLLFILWIMRYILKQIPRYDPQYKQITKKMKKIIPGIIIS